MHKIRQAGEDYEDFGRNCGKGICIFWWGHRFAVSPGRSRAKPRLRLTLSSGGARRCLPRFAQQALSHPRNAPIRNGKIKG